MGIYCYKCKKFVPGVLLRHCCYCGADLRKSVDLVVRLAIPVDKKRLRTILIITGLLCILSLVLMFSPIITRTSKIVSKEEVLPHCQTSDNYEPCDETDQTSYYFTLSDGHEVSVNSDIYYKYEVGDSYTYTDWQSGVVFFIIPGVFFALSLYSLIKSVREKRKEAMAQWEKEGFLPSVCDKL